MSGNYRRSEDQAAKERNRQFAKASRLASRDLKDYYPEEYERFFHGRKVELGIDIPLPMGPRPNPLPAGPRLEETDAGPETSVDLDREFIRVCREDGQPEELIDLPDHGDRQQDVDTP